MIAALGRDGERGGPGTRLRPIVTVTRFHRLPGLIPALREARPAAPTDTQQPSNKLYQLPISAGYFSDGASSLRVRTAEVANPR
jgi:hypothetical protein